MQRFIYFVILCWASLVVGCGRGPSWTRDDYIEIHRDGIAKLSAAQQMNTNYAAVDNFITHFGFGEQPLTWQTVAYIEGRFVLRYSQPVTVDYAKRKLTPSGDAAFCLHATESIRMLDGDRPDSTYDGRLQREFGETKWKKFVSAGYDLVSLDIPKHQIRTVPHWDEYVRAWRKDRIPIE